jgi:alcohol dehydrogenase class IV
MKYNARDAEERYVEIANALNIVADTSKNTVERLITATKTLIAEVEEPQKIEDAGILWGKYQEHLDQLVERAFESTTTMVDPRVPSAEDLKRLFTYAFHGKDIDF